MSTRVLRDVSHHRTRQPVRLLNLLPAGPLADRKPTSLGDATGRARPPTYDDRLSGDPATAHANMRSLEGCCVWHHRRRDAGALR